MVAVAAANRRPRYGPMGKLFGETHPLSSATAAARKQRHIFAVDNKILRGAECRLRLFSG
jgi:hypothetical protein